MEHIATNNKWRDFMGRDAVPEKTLASEFDWLDSAAMDGFFKYHHRWYHLEEFTAFLEGQKNGWDGYLSDSAFSGVVIALSKDGEKFKCGTYCN